MATAAKPLAFCVLKWLYEQVSEILERLKAALLAIIAYIDAQIAILKAWLAQWDLLAQAEKFVYDKVNELIDKLRNEMVSFPAGPLAEFCPEFYSYFLDPALSLFDSTVAALNVFRNRYKNMISYMDEVEQILQYWEQTKADLLHAVDVLDDAIHNALLVEGAALVP